MVYRALVVDDNDVSVAVLSSMLNKYGIVTKTAESGVQALEREDILSFQLFFVDYRMPGMNGVETLQQICEKAGDCKKDRIMFLCTGSEEEIRKTQIKEDFPILQKPIKKTMLEEALKKYISLEVLERQKLETVEGLEILGLDTEYGLERCGDIWIYREMLKEYYRSILKTSQLLKGYAQEFEVEIFQMEVHGLKSTSRLIGALEFAQFCEEVEKECLNYNPQKLIERAEQLICRYESYLEVLKPYGEAEIIDTVKKVAAAEQAEKWFAELKIALEDFDYDKAMEILSIMRQYVLPDIYEGIADKLQKKIDEIDYDGGIAILDNVL